MARILADDTDEDMGSDPGKDRVGRGFVVNGRPGQMPFFLGQLTDSPHCTTHFPMVGRNRSVATGGRKDRGEGLGSISRDTKCPRFPARDVLRGVTKNVEAGGVGRNLSGRPGSFSGVQASPDHLRVASNMVGGGSRPRRSPADRVAYPVLDRLPRLGVVSQLGQDLGHQPPQVRARGGARLGVNPPPCPAREVLRAHAPQGSWVVGPLGPWTRGPSVPGGPRSLEPSG